MRACVCAVLRCAESACGGGALLPSHVRPEPNSHGPSGPRRARGRPAHNFQHHVQKVRSQAAPVRCRCWPVPDAPNFPNGSELHVQAAESRGGQRLPACPPCGALRPATGGAAPRCSGGRCQRSPGRTEPVQRAAGRAKRQLLSKNPTGARSGPVRSGPRLTEPPGLRVLLRGEPEPVPLSADRTSAQFHNSNLVMLRARERVRACASELLPRL